MDSTLAIVLGGIVLGAVLLVVGVAIGRHLPFGRRGPEGLPQASELRRLIGRLYQVVTRVADDVDEHQTRIEQVSQEFSSMHAGDDRPLAGVFLQTVAQAMKTNERLQHRLAEAEERLRDQAEQIESHINEARTDPLTGLPSRRALDDELARRIAEWRRKRTAFCLMMIDIDHFKALNDRYGHPAGDEVLRELARVLRIAFREMDLVARFGGEEFAAILPSTKLEDGKWAAERIRRSVAGAEFRFEQAMLEVTVSLGLAAPEGDDDPASLVRRADEALYASKRAGRNCGHFRIGPTCQRIDFSSRPNRTASNGDGAPDAAGDAELQAVCDDLRGRLAEVIDDA